MILASRIQFLCPSCHTTLKAPMRKRGKISECPVCNYRIKVPVTGKDGGKDGGTDDESVSDLVQTGGFVLRMLVWTACVAWVSFLLWSKCNPRDFLAGALPETPQSIAAGVQILAAYIAARALDSVSRR
jgi:hypothetical protein